MMARLLQRAAVSTGVNRSEGLETAGLPEPLVSLFPTPAFLFLHLTPSDLYCQVLPFCIMFAWSAALTHRITLPLGLRMWRGR
jgi:hypothetical protein